jgi:hypothetical protein
MPSSKGNPTDPELREEVKEEVKAEEKGETMASYPTPNIQGHPSPFFLLSFLPFKTIFIHNLRCTTSSPLLTK